MMYLHAFGDSLFISKVIDFIFFVGLIVYLYNRFGKAWLAAQQDAQNKAVADAVAHRAQCEHAVAEAMQAIVQAKLDATRMVEVGKAQAERLIVKDRAEAQEHAQRILAHAAGELDRERYRVRRELLEETVERATHAARGIVQRDLTPVKQNELVQSVLASLEAEHA
jgi:F-type H+-transporting ATPase subunit b